MLRVGFFEISRVNLAEKKLSSLLLCFGSFVSHSTHSAVSTSQDRLYEIYRMLEPKPKELLENPNRSFVKQGPVILWNDLERKKKDRWFFMFNDTLLIAKRLNGAKPKYRLRVYITLRPQVKVVDVKDSNDPCEFRIVAPTKTFVLFGRTREEKLKWIRWINNTIDKRPLDAALPADASKKSKKPVANGESDEDDEDGDSEQDEQSEELALEDEDELPVSKNTAASPVAAPLAATQGAFAEASDDEEDEDVIMDNPDIQSFVPVLPDKFFTPSGAKLGVRAGGERRQRSATGAAASRRKGTGAILPDIKPPPASSYAAPAAATATATVAKKGRSMTTVPTPNFLQQQTAPPSAAGDLLSFDPIAPAKPTAAATANAPATASNWMTGGAPAPAAAAPVNLLGGWNAPAPAPTQMTLGGWGAPAPQAQPLNPFAAMQAQPFGGWPQQAPQPAQPFGGWPQHAQPQQQQQKQNPFF
jgi:hypothetical protein